jgi:hypothetical protein
VTEREILEARRAHCSTADWVRQKVSTLKELTLSERMRIGADMCRASEQLASRISDERRERIRELRNRIEAQHEDSIRRLADLRR